MLDIILRSGRIESYANLVRLGKLFLFKIKVKFKRRAKAKI